MDVVDTRTVLTREGFDRMQVELDELVKVKRPAVVKRIEEARALGDLAENFDYHDAKRQQGFIEGRIQELKILLSRATVYECDGGSDSVGVGVTVVIKDLEEGFEDTYTIVGPSEADPSDGKISCESTVGAALMGCKVGDTISVETPAGEFKYEVVSIG